VNAKRVNANVSVVVPLPVLILSFRVLLYPVTTTPLTTPLTTLLTTPLTMVTLVPILLTTLIPGLGCLTVPLPEKFKFELLLCVE